MAGCTTRIYDYISTHTFKPVVAMCCEGEGPFDPSEFHPDHKITPLMMLVAYGTVPGPPGHHADVLAPKEDVLALARLMLDAGADPNEAAPPDSEFVVRAAVWHAEVDEEGQLIAASSYDDEDAYNGWKSKRCTLEVPVADRSAYSLLMAIWNEIRNSTDRWSTEQGLNPNDIPDDYRPEYKCVWHEAYPVLRELMEIFEQA